MRNPNDRALAMRDPAQALLLGAISGTDFGAEDSSPGFQFGGFQFAGNFQPSFGDDGDNYGAYGADGAAMAAPVPTPTAQQAMQAFQQQHMRTRATKQRISLLQPNQESDVKVERYRFGAVQVLTLGTAATIALSQAPDVNIRPQRVTSNAPVPNFVSITNIKAANVSGIVGGEEDAYAFNANGAGQAMDFPLLTPANRITVAGAYSNLVPPGYAGGDSFRYTMSFSGWATITA